MFKELGLALLTSSLYALPLFSEGETASSKDPTTKDTQQTPYPLKSPATTSCLSPRPEHATLRHKEARGIGYKKGYTTLEGLFIAHSFMDTNVFPFIDLRAHLFNDGRPAANAGLGLRYLDSRVWGINAYYDYRKTHKMHYNQLAFGLESLGQTWDFRLNGYFPIGKKEGQLHDKKFHKFKEHHLIISGRKEFAMPGIDAEVETHLNKLKHADISVAAGPYYFWKEDRQAVGIEARVFALVYDYLTLQLSGSYDRVFNAIVQGEVGLNFAFGPKTCRTARPDYTCDEENALLARAVQPVHRQEIIVVDKKTELSSAHAHDSSHVLHFIFMDNTNPDAGDGTFENPYNLLSAAESNSNAGDFLYIFEGDGTTTRRNTGLVLKPDQQLFGSGIPHVVEISASHVTIPALTPGYPVLAAPAIATTIVTLSDHNVIEGLIFLADPTGITFGITGTDVSGTVIRRNFLDGTPSGVRVVGLADQFVITDNVFLNYGTPFTAFGVDLEDDPANSSFATADILVANNFFDSPLLTAGTVTEGGILIVKTNPAGLVNATVANNIIQGNVAVATAGGVGIFLNTALGQMGARVENNVLTGNMNGISLLSTGGAVLKAAASNNTMTYSGLEAILMTAGATGQLTADVTGNQMSNNSTTAAVLDVTAVTITGPGDLICLNLFGNTAVLGYTLDNVLLGTFNAVSSNLLLSGVQAVNVGPVVETLPLGNITYVPPATCFP